MNSACDKRILLAYLAPLLMAIGCEQATTSLAPAGGNSSTQTSTFSGRVSENGASSFFPIAGAVLTISDGANAGSTATTNGTGQYTFSELRREAFSVSIWANGYVTSTFSVDLRTGSTRDFSLPLVAPRAPFGGGQFRLGEQLIAGRYFADPLQSGCYWERQRGLSGTLGDIIANKFVTYDGQQFIIDILPSDVGFKSDPKCGTWFDSPRHGPQSSIPPGVWLVGTQVAPGTYESTPSGSCYWERLKNFQHQGFSGVIANGFGAVGKTQSVTIVASDAGFSTDANCGTWTRVPPADR